MGKYTEALDELREIIGDDFDREAVEQLIADRFDCDYDPNRDPPPLSPPKGETIRMVRLDRLTEANATIARLEAERAKWHDRYFREVHGQNNEGDLIGGVPSGLLHEVAHLEAELERVKKVPNWKQDLADNDLPRDIDAAYAKIKGTMRHGVRVAWYCSEDVEYWKSFDEPVPTNPADYPYQGMLIGMEDREARLEIDMLDEAVVIMDEYPAEKHNCELTYIALNRLLDDESVVVFVVHQSIEAELERVTGDRDGLREVVEKYPLTADGKRAYPRMPMWGWVDRHDGSPGRVHRMNWGMDRPEEIEKCYSSEELANEAAAALSARQPGEGVGDG